MKSLDEIMYITPMELEKKNSVFDFPESNIEECKNKRQYPRLETYEDMSFGVMNVMEEGVNKYIMKELNFFITRESLVLVSKEKLSFIEELIKGSSLPPSKLLYVILDKIINKNNGILSEIEKKIVTLEEHVMTKNDEDFTNAIVKIKKELLFLKTYFEPLIDIVGTLADNDYDVIDERAQRGFNNLRQKASRLNDNLSHLRDYISQVREAYQSQIDIKLNRTMQFFTIIATIFMPLTLMTGWYGMNFENMPELRWRYGYLVIIALAVIVFILSMHFLKKKKYI